MNQTSTRDLAQKAQDPGFWLSLCPHLSISKSVFAEVAAPYPADPAEALKARRQVAEEGYFYTGSLIPQTEAAAIAQAVATVVEHGFPAPFVLVFDQVWQMLSRVSGFLVPMLGDSPCMTRDVWLYYIKSAEEDSTATKEEHGWAPHRDGKPVIRTLRPDGRPQLVNVWIPLTDVTVEHSCMHVLPTHLDRNYPHALKEVTIASSALQDVRALPCAAGGVMGWNEYALHWGSRSSRWARGPRISVAARFHSQDAEPFDSLNTGANSTFDFQERLGVIGRVIGRYSARYTCPKPLADFAQRHALLFEAVESFRSLRS